MLTSRRELQRGRAWEPCARLLPMLVSCLLDGFWAARARVMRHCPCSRRGAMLAPDETPLLRSTAHAHVEARAPKGRRMGAVRETTAHARVRFAPRLLGGTGANLTPAKINSSGSFSVYRPWG